MSFATLRHMSTTALYKALLEAGASENLAEKAVESLVFSDQAATKSDIAALKSDIAELEIRLTWRIVLATSITTSIAIGAIGLMVKF